MEDPGHEKPKPFPLLLRLPADVQQIEERWWDEKADENEALPGNDLIRRRALLTLKGTAWVDDTVINRYFEIIVERSLNDDKLPTVRSYNVKYD